MAQPPGTQSFRCSNCGVPSTRIVAGMCKSCYHKLAYGQLRAPNRTSFTNSQPLYYYTPASPVSTKASEYFQKFHQDMLSKKLESSIDEEELILLIFKDLPQEVLDYLWNEFEQWWLFNLSRVVSGTNFFFPPKFWETALAQERNRRELIEFDRREAERQELNAARQVLISRVEKEHPDFVKKYLINKRKGVI